MQGNVTKRAFHQPVPTAVYDADVFSKTLEHLKLEPRYCLSIQGELECVYYTFCRKISSIVAEGGLKTRYLIETWLYPTAFSGTSKFCSTLWKKDLVATSICLIDVGGNATVTFVPVVGFTSSKTASAPQAAEGKGNSKSEARSPNRYRPDSR